MSTTASMARAGEPGRDLPPLSPFVYEQPRTRVVLRPGAIESLGDEVAQLGCARVMVVSGGRSARSALYGAAIRALGQRVVLTFDEVLPHSSTEVVTRAARLAREAGIDALVAIGGGSASDSAKGIAILLAEGEPIERHASRFEPPDRFHPTELHQPKLPIIAIPTTASAAEVTPGLGLRDPTGRKLLFWDVKLASRLIVLDPQANVEVPASLMASTAMNGFAHCAEGLYSRLRNTGSEALALQGIRLFAHWLPRMVREPDSVDARAGVMGAAWLSGGVISNARVGVHHALCHCLGARGGLAHGVANSVMLPHALGFNQGAATREIAAMADALGVDTRGLDPHAAAGAAIEAVRRIQAETGVPRRLRDTGLDRALLPAIAQDALHDRGLYFNPRPVSDAADLLELLNQAW